MSAGLFTYLTAVKSISSQEKTSTAAINAQREQAESERLWQRRADMYVDLLVWCQQAAFVAHEGKDYEDERLYVRDELQARARAFASPYVYNQLEYIAGYHSVRMLNARMKLAGGSPEDKANRMIDEFQKMTDMVHQLSLSIREDLASDEGATNRDPLPELPPLPRLSSSDELESGDVEPPSEHR